MPALGSIRRSLFLAVVAVLAVVLLDLSAPPPSHAQEDAELASEEEGASGPEIAAAKEVLKQTLPPGASREEETRYLVQRERAAFTVGDGKIRLEALRRLVELYKGTPEVHRYWGYLWREEHRSGNQARAFEIGEELIASKGGNLSARAEFAAQLALDYYSIRERQKAWDALATADRLQAEYARTPDQSRAERVTAIVEMSRSNIMRFEGRYAEAETAIRKAQESINRALAQTRERAKSDVFVSLHESNQRYRHHIYGSYVALLSATGRHVEAEAVARQGLQDVIADQTVGTSVAYWTTRIGQAKIAQRQYAEALALLDRALAQLSQAGLAPSSERVLSARQLKLQALLGLERWSDADAEYASMLAVTADDSVGRQIVTLPTLRAMLAALNGRGAEAMQIIEGQVRFRARTYGERNPTTIDAKLVRAMAQQALGQTRIAIASYREAFAVTFSADAVRTDVGTSGLRGFYFPVALKSFLRLVAEQASGGQVAPELASEAFVVADRLRDSVVQQAIIDAATRTIVAANPEIAALIRKEQDIRNARREAFTAMNSLFAEIRDADLALKDLKDKKEETREVQEQKDAALKALETLRKKAAAFDEEQRGARHELTQRFPAYSRLVNPPPVRPADVAKRLVADEALLSVYATATHTFVWAIPARGDPVLQVVPTGAGAIATDVAKLRATLELGSRTQPAPYDFDAAHRLYRVLVQPVASTLTGARVVNIVAGGPLGQIPFAVLVKEPAAQDGYEGAAWLVKDFALSHASSVSAWLSVRDTVTKAKAARPFVGFGDPQFSAQPVQAPSKPVRAAITTKLAKRSADQPAAAFDYGTIPPLPETRDEILAIARSLKADPATSTFFGLAASRSRVVSTDLREYRVIAFATHGLRAGDLPDLSQPALAMAASAGPDESPLLTLDDILKLQLGADWVVLSACNTAASDGTSEEAISGLGRGFFFAGTRSMLVTHWAVESLSAQALVTRLFEHFGHSGGAPRAESLRQAQLELIAGKFAPQYRHPFYWAPYVLVGDPVR